MWEPIRPHSIRTHLRMLEHNHQAQYEDLKQLLVNGSAASSLAVHVPSNLYREQPLRTVTDEVEECNREWQAIDARAAGHAAQPELEGQAWEQAAGNKCVGLVYCDCPMVYNTGVHFCVCAFGK